MTIATLFLKNAPTKNLLETILLKFEMISFEKFSSFFERSRVEMMFYVVEVFSESSKFSNFECWQERSSVACTLDEKSK